MVYKSLFEENKRYITNVKDLETDSGDFVTHLDLQQRKPLVWQYKGVAYTIEVISVHGKSGSKLNF